MTPEYQDDVDKERWFSIQHVSWLIGGSLLLIACGYASDNRILYGLLSGGMIVPELVIYVRHFENILYFRQLCLPAPGVSGQLITSTCFTYKHSFWHEISVGILALGASALTGSPIFLGGSVGVGVLAIQDLQHARRFRSAANPRGDENVEDQANA